MNGIILAGGRATRLGPLTAQLSKALITVGQQPMLVHQVRQLRAAGCEKIQVITSPDSDTQVRGVIERAGLTDVWTQVQPVANGPASAIYCGLIGIMLDSPVTVLMADTVLADDEVTMPPDSVATALAPAARSFCVRGINAGKWHDMRVKEETPYVAVGLFRFDNPARLRNITKSAAQHPFETGMADVLNTYGSMRVNPVSSWQDVGDVPALARANREHFMARPGNDLRIDRPGTVTKSGNVYDQVSALHEVPRSGLHLFPRVIDSDRQSYTMEHIDMPSLAELWLYWPSRPEMWEHVAEELVSQLRDCLWRGGTCPYDATSLRARARAMYSTKLLARYAEWPEHFPTEFVTPGNFYVNGVRCLSGHELIDAVVEHATDRLAESAPRYAGWIHGDPNFTNVLWSLRTGSFKLLDPRGNFGGATSWGDTRYDVGKIAYSPEFSAITHGLFSAGGSHAHWGVRIWPQRDDEVRSLRLNLPLDHHEYHLLRSYLFLSSAPLHTHDEGRALYLLGALEFHKYQEAA